MSFKDISIFSTDGNFVQQGRKGLCNFDKGHYEKHFCEIIFNLGQWLRRCLMIFLFLALVASLFSEVDHLALSAVLSKALALFASILMFIKINYMLK